MIDCLGNGLTTLPPSLTSLICSNNKLKTPPPFPASLEHLECRGNNFSEETYAQLVEFFSDHDDQDNLKWAQSRLDEIRRDLMSADAFGLDNKMEGDTYGLVEKFIGKGRTKRRRTMRKKTIRRR